MVYGQGDGCASWINSVHRFESMYAHACINIEKWSFFHLQRSFEALLSLRASELHFFVSVCPKLRYLRYCSLIKWRHMIHIGRGSQGWSSSNNGNICKVIIDFNILRKYWVFWVCPLMLDRQSPDLEYWAMCHIPVHTWREQPAHWAVLHLAFPRLFVLAEFYGLMRWQFMVVGLFD